jgi:fatty-acyl-CoA synthase
LKLITQNRSTVSFSPPFGYELCVKRLRISDISKFDLSSWRLAGIGAETIRPEPLQQFAVNLAPAGFRKDALVACYGMAECSLAVSFASLERGIKVDYVDAEHLAETQEAIPVETPFQGSATKSRQFVICGEPLPGYDVEVRDELGRSLPDRHCGTLFVRGASVMSGYFGEKELTAEVLSEDGWLNTGDLAYRIKDDIIITGRQKDLIILNGRNIWPQDMEFLAEQQPDLRTGDASAFSVTGPNGEDLAVLVIECRATEEAKRADLVNRLHSAIRTDLGIDCFIELVARNTLPRTTSGKLSRSGALKGFLARVENGQTLDPFAEARQPAPMKKAV